MSQTFFVKREITYLINFSILLFPYYFPTLDRYTFFTCVTKLGKLQ
jgi:hypothetical protein